MITVRSRWLDFQHFLVTAIAVCMLHAVGVGSVYAQQEPRTREDFDFLIRSAQRADDTWSRMQDQLNQSRRLPGLLVRTESGGMASISDEQAENLAAAVALNAMVLGTDGRVPVLAIGGSQLEIAISKTLLGVREQIVRRAAKLHDVSELHLDASRVGDFVRREMLQMLEAYDRENRASIAAELKRIDTARSELLKLVEYAQTARTKSLPSGVGQGFLNKPGYYVMKTSGSGWRKRFSGFAIKIEGHHFSVIKVDDGVREPKRESFHWTLPTGVDIRSLMKTWQEDARKASARNCAASPPLCPCAAPPDIWEDGPSYTITQGPFRSFTEARTAAGDSYAANGKPESNKQWRYTDRRSDDLMHACRALGVGK